MPPRLVFMTGRDRDIGAPLHTNQPIEKSQLLVAERKKNSFKSAVKLTVVCEMNG